MTFAEAQFRAMRPMADGSTMAEHQESAARQIAKMGLKRKAAPVAIEAGPPCPPELEYLWRMFLELAAGIQPNGWSPPIVSWVDLHAWRSEAGVTLARWEALALIRLGQLRAQIVDEQSRTK